MENEETSNPDYQKGFNEGYLMTQHLPGLSEQIVNALGHSDRSAGFKDGRNEFNLEKIQDRMPAYLKVDFSTKEKHPDKSKDKDIDLDKD